ncbi:NERD domain-containing protein [Pedobacter roseus]|uniref:NERD domain-containing protein n=1 Tax=Pedobacter roseus TaxID=336820 RepID=A0A7G9QH00_9SPHI|nr:NERD domain-containing protein [Pedobacter roseus]QNN42625.1 hypothetical protein H9L23_00455 [Pedobacter roseus]
MDELEAQSKKLKQLVGKYDPDVFVGRITTLIKTITMPSQKHIYAGLISPFRQLIYLMNLNLTSPIEEVKDLDFPQRDWDGIKAYLRSINTIYDQTYGEQKVLSQHLDEEQFVRNAVSLSTYTAFFHQGPLKFEEQVIEKILRVFKNIHQELEAELGLNPADFIAIYDELDKLCHRKLNRAWDRENKEENEYLDSIQSGIKLGKYSFREGMATVGEKDMELMQALTNPAASHYFSLADLEGKCGTEKLAKFLSYFSLRREHNERFLYFSGANQLLKKPIYRMGDGQYLVIDYKVLLDAIYEFLTVTAKSILKDSNRITRVRDKYLELKVTELFKDFYSRDKGARFYENFHVDGSEHDLLILSGKTAIIVEVKAGNIREPTFDPGRAYDKIKKDFNNTIGYGYEQTFKIKEFFLDRANFDITDDENVFLETIDTRPFKQVFSVVVTLEKFGHIQNDLSKMLSLFEDDRYPWSVCLDDMEIFLLAMKNKNMTIADFHLFLNLRQNLHANLQANDEGRVTGYFLSHKNFLKMRKTHGKYNPVLDDDLIYDNLYKKVLGFKDERNVEFKTNPGYIHLM